MANDSSLGGATGAFDLETQSGVMQLLASIRASEVDADDKAELRDLVFLYTNGGHDESVKNSLLQKLVTAGVTPVQIEKPQPAVEPEKKQPAGPSIGASRPAPLFTPSTQQFSKTQSTPEPAPAPETAPAPAPEPIAKPEPVPTPTPEPQPEPVSEPVQPEPEPEPEVPVAPEQTSVPVAPPAPHVAPVPAPEPMPEPAVAPSPVPTPEPTLAPSSESVASSEEQLRRIREIKSLVNERVGNPVNLVDINNEVGREYMSALLDAMKRLNNGSSSTGAMQRLETAFAEVEKAIDAHEQSGGEVPEVPEVPEAPEAPQPTEPVSLPEVPVDNELQQPVPPEPQSIPEVPKVPPAPVPMPESEPAVPEMSATPVPLNIVPEPVSSPEAQVPTSSQVQAEEPAQSEANSRPPIPRPPTLNSVPPAPEAPTQEPDSLEGAEELPKTPPAVMPVGAPAPKPDEMPTAGVQAPAWGPETDPTPIKDNGVRKKSASLAESGEPLRNINELPDASSLDTAADGDPLHTKEVDQGLNQLLSEWSLFKKSGLFGTGPKGAEHPLFLKIKDLQIPLLLAGRFEGATQEIKQSITDYMNGWRYEQGIIYKQGETFEQYLRRVIRHIIDLQKK